MIKRAVINSTVLVSILWSFSLAGGYTHHDVSITLNPAQNFISVEDQIIFSDSLDRNNLYFLLHGDLSLDSTLTNVSLIQDSVKASYFGLSEDKFILPERIPYRLYRINQPGDSAQPLVIRYQGRINHPIEQRSAEYARGFSETPGLITEQGVYLAGSTFWLPWFNEQLVTFNMNVSVPGNWDAVSQGKRAEHRSENDIRFVRWESPNPVDEVYLVAAQFTLYERRAGEVQVMAYLRTPDPGLANKYLETTDQYLEMYDKLIGTYPYSKFALVENFWETGYGMPSFTLLGEKVIRFPFILHSSYPHELLHNWWGNGVFVDYDRGNWCEGLTAYMADHLIKEQKGQGEEYRRSALQAYRDYVNQVNEIPLREFRSRHDAATSAIGYNKSLMLFHMLRRDVGDDLFNKSLQTFYRLNKFKKVGFNEIKDALESVSGKTFGYFFDQWINRTGAPELALSDVNLAVESGQYNLTYTLSQMQEGEPFLIRIPVAVYTEGTNEIMFQQVDLTKKSQNFRLILDKRPLRIRIDAQFDVFRRLDRNEIPPALSEAFGSEKIMIVLGSADSADWQASYRSIAEAWAKDDSTRIEIRMDTELAELPSDRAVWLFGDTNRFRPVLEKAIEGYDAALDSSRYRFGNESAEGPDKSVVVTARHPQRIDQILVWLKAGSPAAMPGLARKLPHYGKYSYLIFEGDEPSNTIKGQWPVIGSPLDFRLDESANLSGILFPKREPLAKLGPVFSEKNLIAHVNYLASPDLEGRGFGTTGLKKAAVYIADQFNLIGLKPAGDSGSYFQSWIDIGGPDKIQDTLRNVIGYIPGTTPEYSDQAVIVCAHYDHLGMGWPDVRAGNEGKLHPGADDNASGVAVMIELAKILKENATPKRPVVFIALCSEEYDLRGSRYYVENMKKFPVKKTIGVLNLDTVGRLGQNKILILNNASADEWKHIAMGISYVTGIEHELVKQDLDASDQVSFIDAGVPAVQIFAGAHGDYHTPEDTPDKIDAQGMVKIAMFVKEAVDYLSEREEPLTFAGSVKDDQAVKSVNKSRKVSTGIMPEFTFDGAGVKIAHVTEGSSAAKAGLQIGDIIIQLDYKKIGNLKEYSELLKSYSAGDEVTFVFMRGQQEMRVQLELAAR